MLALDEAMVPALVPVGVTGRAKSDGIELIFKSESSQVDFESQSQVNFESHCASTVKSSSLLRHRYRSSPCTVGSPLISGAAAAVPM